MELSQVVHAFGGLGFAHAPIYKKGVEIKGKTMKGKSPLPAAQHQIFSIAACAQYLEREPQKYAAIGLVTGHRSKGIVCFDVDANLHFLMEKFDWLKNHYKTDTPQVTSTKKNAVKLFFRVPEEHWANVCTVRSKEGYEILWGPQALVWGEYPGHEATGSPEGRYSLRGNWTDVPDAPEGLLRLLFEAKAKRKAQEKVSSFIPETYKTRSKDEQLEIARCCLGVIPNEGAGSEDQWWKIGAALYSITPDEEALQLWEEWSKRDIAYADEWEKGNPCADRWEVGFQRSGISVGSLVFWADLADPHRERFQGNAIASVVEECSTPAVRIKNEVISGKEIVARAKTLEETIEDPAELDQAKHQLALLAGRRSAADVDRLLDMHDTYEASNQGKPRKLGEYLDTERQYVIPGLLPKRYTTLIHGAGGTGKSYMALVMAKHVVRGTPMNVHGVDTNVPKGRVLYCNSDQTPKSFEQAAGIVGLEPGEIDVLDGFDLLNLRKLKILQQQESYDLIIIDSLSAAMVSSGISENAAEYAGPLRRLVRMNGSEMPEACIGVLHHENKSGGFRGTTAIRDAVDETMQLSLPTSDVCLSKGLTPGRTRLCTVHKSRDERMGHEMAFTLLPDFTYLIGNVEKEDTHSQMASPSDLMVNVLRALVETGEPLSIKEIREMNEFSSPGMERPIRYAIKRLFDQKLVLKVDAPASKAKPHNRPPVYYTANGQSSAKSFLKRSLSIESVQCVNSESVSEVCTGMDLKEGTSVKRSVITGSCKKGGDAGEEGDQAVKRGLLQSLNHAEIAGEDPETPSPAVEEALQCVKEESFYKDTGHTRGPGQCESPHQAAISNVMEQGWKMWD